MSRNNRDVVGIGENFFTAHLLVSTADGWPGAAKSTNQWRQAIQVMLSKVDKNWYWLLQCWLLLWKAVSQFSARVLPAVVVCGRCSGNC